VKILVTGGAGFIGSHVVDAYIAAGHEVAVLDDLSTGSEGNVHREAKLLRLDVRDKEGVAAAIAAFRPEVVNHHAAQAEVPKSVADPGLDAMINIVGIEFLINFGGLGQLINDLAERYDLPGTYGAICFVVLTSIVFFDMTERLERWLRPIE